MDERACSTIDDFTMTVPISIFHARMRNAIKFTVLYCTVVQSCTLSAQGTRTSPTRRLTEIASEIVSTQLSANGVQWNSMELGEQGIRASQRSKSPSILQ